MSENYRRSRCAAAGCSEFVRLKIHRYCGLACSTRDKREARAREFETLFWLRVNKNGPIIRAELGPCWPWTGGRTGAGYGNLKRAGKWDLAHRVAFVLSGKSLAPGLIVRHKCDFPPCCNPDHLLPGTKADNVADMDSRGRRRSNPPRGDGHPKAKLTEKLVKEIRIRVASGERKSDLANEFGVSDTAIHSAVSGKNWKRSKRESA